MDIQLHTIRKGFDIRLSGAPVSDVETVSAAGPCLLSPAAVSDLKPKLLVKAGDRVRRGTPVVEDKRIAGLRLCSPISGTVQEIQYGDRRAIRGIRIEPDGRNEMEPLDAVHRASLDKGDRKTILEALLQTGAWIGIRQRPFSHLADPAATPKAIFVNAMNTAPFQADPEVVVRGQEPAFQAGLRALTRLTDGAVHLCFGPAHRAFFEKAGEAPRVQGHVFRGKHPAGNTSIHIHEIAPIRPHDIVWTVRAADVVRLGAVFTEGLVPNTRVIALGGPAVRPEARRHYRVPEGLPLETLLRNRMESGDIRIVSGDALSGSVKTISDPVGLDDTSFTLLPEGGDRTFMGWLLPGLFQFSASRSFLSTWLRPRATWTHGTLLHGGLRSMVVTGLYEKYIPMRIFPDYLIRAVLAGDTTEAVQLGLLETDPEDFALAAFACPSKMDLMKIIRKGLDDVEAEGL